MSNAVNPCDIHRRPARFLRMYTSRNTASLDYKGLREGEMKEGCWIPYPICRKQPDKTALKTHATLHEKGRMTPRAQLKGQKQSFEPPIIPSP